MARGKRRGRLINGILVLDKPPLLSSNAALQEAKRLYFAAKAGHTGSLDPLATGVLPLCFGEATKFSQFLLDADKAYASTFVLGALSSTGDADGEISAGSDVSGITQPQVEEHLQAFLGTQLQIPPMYSALKQNGQRLYELARKGQEVERKPREIHVASIVLKGFRLVKHEVCSTAVEVDVELKVSKGTYIRSIATDLGNNLGVGGYVGRLRRTQAGPFDEEQIVTMDTLRALKQEDRYEAMDELLVPIDSALPHIPSVSLDESMGFYIRRGQAVQMPDAPDSGIVKLVLETGDFIGVGEVIDDGRIAPRRLVV